ncbi:NADH dehydrogenase [ubiquinone] 1 beta subcomplex subunit 3 [Pseudolycoriella hygida]|uniref:NADH dehydrogenase [ubiquinone] 1 beta subcomplex subunit 3 n=1 Tax=Pseudolycoriella hygida TaxID=35572 RepID=A0A9Q0NHX1_9DIPT|nr:NADH dehydrogenase [ubiquinone] 1 beta subcomplex subunit 3 [Pseudolycoriella hygida]
MGGHGHGEHHAKIKIPKADIYKVADSKELLEVEQALARRGLKDPWLRNEVWRYNVKEFGTTRGKLVKFLFRGLPLGAALTAATVAIEYALNKNDSHGHGHGAEGGHH